MVQVVASKFEPADLEPPAFYEEPWFAMLVRYGTALLAVLLVLLLAVRPLIGKLKGKGGSPANPPADDAPLAVIGADDDSAANGTTLTASDNGVAIIDLPRQVELARRLAASQPERAVEALQRMLEAPEPRASEAGAA